MYSDWSNATAQLTSKIRERTELDTTSILEACSSLELVELAVLGQIEKNLLRTVAVTSANIACEFLTPLWYSPFGELFPINIISFVDNFDGNVTDLVDLQNKCIVYTNSFSTTFTNVKEYSPKYWHLTPNPYATYPYKWNLRGIFSEHIGKMCSALMNFIHLFSTEDVSFTKLFWSLVDIIRHSQHAIHYRYLLNSDRLANLPMYHINVQQFHSEIKSEIENMFRDTFIRFLPETCLRQGIESVAKFQPLNR